jgi:exosortase
MKRIYILSYVLILFFVGLLPFNFFQINKAGTSETSGLQLNAPGIVYSKTLPEKLLRIKEFTILIDLSSYLSDWSSGYARILTYSLSNNKMNFMIGQWSESLIFRINADNSPRTIHFETEWFFNKYETTSLAIIYDGNTLSSYRNGVKIKEMQVGKLSFDNWNGSYPLVIGSEAEGKNCWQGYIYSISVYDRVLSPKEIGKGQILISKDLPLIRYSFKTISTKTIQDSGKGSPANLVIPHFFKPYKRTMLEFDYGWLFEHRHYYMDLWINIIGFIPLGFLLSAYLRMKRFSYISVLLQSIAAGSGISLSIELLQTLLPDHTSSLTDVISSVFGVAAGVIVFRVARRLRSSYPIFDIFKRNKATSFVKKDLMHGIIGIDKRNILFLFACFIAIAMFYNPLRELMRIQFQSESYLHVALIPLISGYLIYERWDTLVSRFSYSWKAGTILLCMGLVLFIVGKSQKITLNVNDHASFITLSACIFLIGTFILLYGLEAFRAALFPLLFVVFMIPIPSKILNWFIHWLQFGSSLLTGVIFNIFQVPFEQHGYIFNLPHNVSIEVADQCSGIHSTLALLIISLLAGHLFLKNYWKKIILVLLVFPLALIKNSFRIAALSLLGSYVDERIITQGFLHRSGGFLFYIPSLAILLTILWLFRRSEGRTEEKLSEKGTSSN